MILGSQPEIKPASPTLEGKILTTGLPGKSLVNFMCFVLGENIFIQRNVVKSKTEKHLHIFQLNLFQMYYLLSETCPI